MKIIADLHTHTRYSHGKGTVLDNVAVALAKGLQCVAITDHGPRSAPWVGASLKDFAAMRQEVWEVDRRTVGFHALAGVECNIVSARGALDLPLHVRRELDIVLAGLHPGALPASGRDWLLLTGNNWAAKFHRGLRRKARLINTQAVVEAVYTNEIDVITHPGYGLDIDTEALARACAQRDTALEISARHHEMTVAFIRVAARHGVRFVINSDAHKPAEVGNFSRGIAVALAAGLGPEQVLNSDRGGLFDWLHAKQSRRSAGRGLDNLPGEPAGAPIDPASPRTTERRSYWTDWSEQGGGNVH